MDKMMEKVVRNYADVEVKVLVQEVRKMKEAIFLISSRMDKLADSITLREKTARVAMVKQWEASGRKGDPPVAMPSPPGSPTRSGEKGV